MNTAKEKLPVNKIRKFRRKNPIDDNRELLKFAKSSSRAAIGELLNSGISVVYVKNGKLVRENPDGKITVVDTYSKAEKFDLKEYLCQE